MADDGHRADDQQPSQVSIALLGDAVKPVLAFTPLPALLLITLSVMSTVTGALVVSIFIPPPLLLDMVT
jgi:hypothetical protein